MALHFYFSLTSASYIATLVLRRQAAEQETGKHRAFFGFLQRESRHLPAFCPAAERGDSALTAASFGLEVSYTDVSSFTDSAAPRDGGLPDFPGCPWVECGAQ